MSDSDPRPLVGHALLLASYGTLSAAATWWLRRRRVEVPRSLCASW